MGDKIPEVKFTVIKSDGTREVKKIKVQSGFEFNFADELGYYYGSSKVNDNGKFVVTDGAKRGTVHDNHEITEKQFLEYQKMAGLVNDGGLTNADKDKADLNRVRSIVTQQDQNAKTPDNGFKWYNPLTWF